MKDSPARVWLMPRDDLALTASPKNKSFFRGAHAGDAKDQHAGAKDSSGNPSSWDTRPSGSNPPPSAYRRFCHWFGSLLRARIKPSDVILVRGLDQPLLKAEDVEPEEAKHEDLPEVN
ncbi:uncharacterized protein LOC122246262 [Penaeus japonicus]|uniref:uncharacterized protein LOC122246262 n=1 Tax=Penaeus japonicus TaxID=27405 RepID=UPI001C70EF4B|nr:uncharacterized protein LOC122246262 [Penaeus japonicus]